MRSIQDMPQSSVSSEAENVSIVEKSSVEIMEKNIEKNLISNDDVKKNNIKPELKDVSHSPVLTDVLQSANEGKDFSSEKIKSNKSVISKDFPQLRNQKLPIVI
ncbi:protein unc-79 [Caerostris extrusa]|uniref:Protein unc-79 n=1 Tax=Caerostris extrusa TaxID=172846 RepID=A0AAV4Q6N5_CAEEX|nr:protein unc-79 [Caerostris extrusa]